MATILIPIPSHDFDPTEVAVPWNTLNWAGHRVLFATPDGKVAAADPIMVTGKGLGIWKGILPCEPFVRTLYRKLEGDPLFRKPLSYEDAASEKWELIVLPGGHAQGMKPYLESEILQTMVADQDAGGRYLAVICHGVVLAARSKRADGKSILYGKKTTALLRRQEHLAYTMTRLWMGSYYLTYPDRTVQDEVTAALEKAEDFIKGPMPVARDREDQLDKGFVVQDGNYISARWPGDVHRFAKALVDILNHENP